MDNNELLEKLVEVQEMLAKDLKTKAPATSATNTFLHGPTGIFSVPGTDPDVVSTLVRPVKGISDVLPMRPTISTTPYHAALTGVTDDSGDEPDTPCDDAPTGYTKSCYITAPLGHLMRDTQTINIKEVADKVNRGDFTDLMLHGKLLAGLGPNVGIQNVLNVVTQNEMMNLVVRMERKMSKIHWQGSTANNVGTGYEEWPGLDTLIATGYVDAKTNTSCPSLDSDVKDFNFNLVTGTSPSIINFLSSMMYYLERLSEQTGVDPVQWVIAMRPQLFFELSRIWPCAYMSDGCAAVGVTPTSATVVNVNDSKNADMRWMMWQNRVIPINGTFYPVILDDGIYEYNNINNANCAVGQYASAIYAVPVAIEGGRTPVTWFEHKDYRAIRPDLAALGQLSQYVPSIMVTDNGRFIWAGEDTGGYCFKLKCTIEPRIILKTPWLAGKIQRVKYAPLQHERDFDPDDPYYVDGGLSLRSADTIYNVWGSETQR